MDYASFLGDEKLLKVFIMGQHKNATSAAQDKSFQEAIQGKRRTSKQIVSMRGLKKKPEITIKAEDAKKGGFRKVTQTDKTVPAVEEKVLGYPISNMSKAALPWMFRGESTRFDPLLTWRRQNQAVGDSSSEGDEEDHDPLKWPLFVRVQPEVIR